MRIHVTTRLLSHPADAINLLRIALSWPILLLPLFFAAKDTSSSLVIGFGVWFLLSDMNFILHQHVHYPITRSKLLNRAIDFFLSVVTGMSASNWRQHHVLRHHEGNDNWSNLFDWETQQFSYFGYVSYSIRYGISMIAFPFVEAFWLGVVKRNNRQFSYLASFIEQTAVIMIASYLIFRVPAFYAPYYFFVTFFTAATDYENHVGCDDSEYGFSNNTTNQAYNWVRNNFGYHTAHHYFPNAHWTELPKLHRQIAKKIPPDRIKTHWWTGYLTPPLLLYFAYRFLGWNSKSDDSKSVET